MSDGTVLGLVERGRDAAARRDWQQALDLLLEADADDLLTAADLPMLAEVAYAAGDLDMANAVRQLARERRVLHERYGSPVQDRL